LGESAAAAAAAATEGQAVVQPAQDVVEQVSAVHGTGCGGRHARAGPGISDVPHLAGAERVAVARGPEADVGIRCLAVAPGQEAQVVAQRVRLVAHARRERQAGAGAEEERTEVTDTAVLAARRQAEADRKLARGT